MYRLYVIWSIEHSAWWAPGRMGYVREVEKAGIYTDEDSRRILESANGELHNPVTGAITGVRQLHEARIPLECMGALGRILRAELPA